MTGLGLDRRAAGDRLQGADRARCPATSASAPATWSSTPSWPTRPTRSAPRSPAPRGVATDSLDLARARRRRRCCGSTRRPTRPAGCCRAEHLRKVVDWCRERGTILVSDECYLECAWEAEPVSVLHPDGQRRLARRASSPSTRCPSGPTSPATAAPSSPATRRWSASCSPSARTSACRCPARSRSRWSPRSTTTDHVVEQHARYAARRAVLRAALGGRLPDRPLRGVALPLGDPRRGLLGDRGLAGRARHPRGARRVLRRRPAPGTCGSPSPPPTSGSTPPSPASSALSGSASTRRRRLIVAASNWHRAAGVGAGTSGTADSSWTRALTPRRRQSKTSTCTWSRCSRIAAVAAARPAGRSRASRRRSGVRGPDPVVEDHRLDVEPVGLGDEVLRDRPAARSCSRADRPDEDVDRAAVVVGRALHVAAC